jgi:ElaA protein
MTRSAHEPSTANVGSGPVRSATFAQLDPATLYAILQLRSDVFVLEQRCNYRDLDGRDTEPTTRHLWVTGDDGAVCAYLRVLDEGDGTTRIGRVVTAPAHRGRGLADLLVRHALAAAPGDVLAAAQAHLVEWYQRRGFRVDGSGFVEDGIEHVPMRYALAEAGCHG